jgi:hypothetical protein
VTTPEDTAPHLFIVRIWTDPAGAPSMSRGLVEHVQTKERRYFRVMEELSSFIAGRLGGAGGDSYAPSPPS